MRCIIIDDDLMSTKALEGLIAKHGEFDLVQSFLNPMDAITYLKDEIVDLIFLDIEMPELSGIEFFSLYR